MDCSMPGFPVYHQLLEPTQTHVHCIGDAIQPPHPLLAPFFSRLQYFPALSVTVSIVSPSICHEEMGPDAMILVFWILRFKPTFSLSSFTFIKRLFSSSFSAISVVSSAYLKLLIFLPAMLIPACASFNPAFLLMYYAAAAAAAKSLQSCLTLWDPTRLPPSLGFPRQEHWSGLPFPSPDHSKLRKTLKEMEILDHFTSLLRNFYAEHIMRNAGLHEAQAEIRIAGKNINNLRYADETTLMAKSKE